MNFIEEFRQKHTRRTVTQLKSIQTLRAFAAIAVMIAHLQSVEARHAAEHAVLPPMLMSGFAGVDLFFVISGFIMVWIAGDWAPGSTSAAKFLFARVTRIYPVWWLFAALTALYFLIANGVPWDADLLSNFEVGGAEHLIKSMLLVPHEAFPVLTLGWTLMHEMYFYLVFALLLLLPGHLRSGAMIAWAGLIGAGMLFGATGFYADSLMSLALYPMTLEFLLGAAIGLVIKSGWRRFALPALGLSLIGFVAAIWVVDFTSKADSLPILRTCLFGPPAALLVYAVAALELNQTSKPWLHSSLVRIGDWSYSLYLCHILVISAVAELIFPTLRASGLVSNLAFIVLASAAALIVAGLTYTLFEAPLHKRARAARTHLFKPPSDPAS